MTWLSDSVGGFTRTAICWQSKRWDGATHDVRGEFDCFACSSDDELSERELAAVAGGKVLFVMKIEAPLSGLGAAIGAGLGGALASVFTLGKV